MKQSTACKLFGCGDLSRGFKHYIIFKKVWRDDIYQGSGFVFRIQTESQASPMAAAPYVLQIQL